ncbi:MAG TPA: MFS transporter [bacterium]|nr:MFS transporter [bacterium]
MNKQIVEISKIRGMYWAITSEVFNTIFCYLTVFGSVFLLFLNELKIPAQRIGLLLSFFPFFGIIAPFLSSYVEYTGSKKVFLSCWATRKITIACLLFLPWIINRYGYHAGTLYLTGIIMVFAFLRAIAETAYYAWLKEFVPDHLRGKYTALGSIFPSIAGLMAIFFASYVIGKGYGVQRYMLTIGTGCIAGFISVFLMSFVPGGNPVKDKKPSFKIKKVLEPLKDKNFINFLCSIGCGIFGLSLMVFLPIFAKEKLSFLPGQIVFLDNATILGYLLTGFLWGHLGDRFGGRPVMITGLLIYCFVPLAWLFLPREEISLFRMALVLYFIAGSTQIARSVGTYRILYAGIIGNNEAIYYTSIYYAWIGLVGGFAPLFAGYELEMFSNLLLHFPYFTFDAYSVLFLINFLCQISAIFFIRKVKSDKQFTTRELFFKLAQYIFERR